jgi:hypothetical protein
VRHFVRVPRTGSESITRTIRNTRNYTVAVIWWIVERSLLTERRDQVLSLYFHRELIIPNTILVF